MSQDTKTSPVIRIGGLVLLALAGAVVGSVAARYIDVSGISGADALNLFIAVVLIGASVATSIVFALKSKSLPYGCGPLEALVTALAGIMLLIPLYATTWVSAEIALGAVTFLLVVQSVLNFMLWRRADEMLRRIMIETMGLAFWALQLALFVYAASERLGLIESLSAWGMIGIMMTVYLVASAIAAARRGVQ